MSTVLDLLYAPMLPFLDRPYLALVPAVIFGFGHASLRPRAPRPLAVAALLWVAYAAWETYMYFWSKTVPAPIRVDLLMLAPALYFFTALGVFTWWRAARDRAG